MPAQIRRGERTRLQPESTGIAQTPQNDTVNSWRVNNVELKIHQNFFGEKFSNYEL